MVTLNVVVDDSLLASYVIANYKEDRFIPYAVEKFKKDIVSFQNLAWETSKDKCMVIDSRYPLFKYKTSLGSSYDEAGHTLDEFINALTSSEEFKKLKEQTEQSKKYLLKEWDKNFEETLKYIENIGIKPDGEYTIFLVHQGLKAGNNIGNNKIIWSYQEYWPNYNTVYIWHEILHSNIEHGNKGHALIELVTDEEMRTRLNGDSYPPYVGHKYLNEEKDQLLPKWKEYLKSDRKDIRELLG